MGIDLSLAAVLLLHICHFHYSVIVTQAVGAEVSVEQDDFTYEDSSAWPLTHPVCGGDQQSPVRLSVDHAKKSFRNDTVCGKYMCLKERFNYPSLAENNAKGAVPVMALLANTGHRLTLSIPQGAGVPWFVNATGRLFNLYYLKNISFHFPAEHIVDGKQHLGELQLLHESPTGRTIVISLLLTSGDEVEPGNFLDALQLPSWIPNAGWARKVDLRNMNIMSTFEDQLAGSFFRYDGSLTAPPCTEDIYWLVMRQPAPILCKGDAEAFRKVLGANARLPQPLGQRGIMLDSIIVYAVERVGTCPEPDADGSIHIGGCVRTCVVAEKFITARIKCPDACPIQAPCARQQDIRCIVGSEEMDIILKDVGMVPWDAPALHPNSFCNYYNPVSQVDLEHRACVTCRVGMCQSCKSDTVCAKCLPGYKVADDGNHCIDAWAPVWMCLYPLVLIGVLSYVLWLITLSLRTSTGHSSDILEKALRSKWMSCPRDVDKGGRAFSAWKVWQWHTDDRLGAGLTAFFGFMWLVIATVVFSGLVAMYFQRHYPHIKDATYRGHGATLTCSLVALPPQLLQNQAFYRDNFTGPILTCSICIYVVAMCIAFFFELWLDSFTMRKGGGSNRHLMASCCVTLESLPQDLTSVDALESWASAVLRKEGYGSEELIGASLAFRPPAQSKLSFNEAFDEAVELIIEEADDELERSYSFHPVRLARRQLRQGRRCGLSFSALHFLDGICGYQFSQRKLLEGDIDLAWRLGPALRSLRGAGSAHVVFRSDTVAHAFRKEVGKVPPRWDSPLGGTWFWLTGRSRDDSLPVALAQLREPFLPADRLEDEEKVLAGPAFSVDGTPYQPYAKAVSTAAENIDWDQYSLSMTSVRGRVWEIPTHVAKALVLMLLLLWPNLAFFAKNARATADEQSWVWQLQTQVLGFICGLGYQVMGSTAWSVSRKCGATTMEKQRMVMLTFITLCAGSVTFANVFFNLKVMTPAWQEHMIQIGQRPTYQDAEAQGLFNTIWPGCVAMGYVVEPLMGVLVPQYVNYNVCRSRGGTRSAAERSLRFPTIDPTWQLADLIVKTSLCFTMMFYISRHTWGVCLHYGILLMARYLYLAVTWSCMATTTVYKTTDQTVMALNFWRAIPLAILAGSAGFWGARHVLGLKLPPLDLPNGPSEPPYMWAVHLSRLAGGLAVAAHWLLTSLLRYMARLIAKKTKRLIAKTTKQVTHTSYTEAKQASPADYFNTNLPLTLMVHNICHGDPAQLLQKIPKEIRKRGLLMFAEVFLKLAEAERSSHQRIPEQNALRAQAVALAAFWPTDKDVVLEERIIDPPKFLSKFEGVRFKEFVNEVSRPHGRLLQQILKQHAEHNPPNGQFGHAIRLNARKVLMPWVAGKAYLQGGAHCDSYKEAVSTRPSSRQAYANLCAVWIIVALAAFKVNLNDNIPFIG